MPPDLVFVPVTTKAIFTHLINSDVVMRISRPRIQYC